MAREVSGTLQPSDLDWRGNIFSAIGKNSVFAVNMIGFLVPTLK